MDVASFVYTTVLRPKPLKAMANAAIRMCVPRRLKRNGAVIVLNPGDPVISGALTLGVYERAETRFFCAACRPGMTFLDIGANVGYYTALACARIGSTGRIVALEPDRENFGYLRQTVEANGFPNAICVPKAAASERGTLRLYISLDNRGDNRLYPNDLSDASYEVPVAPVDEILKECGVDGVNLVKIDVQGFEGHVLQGMRRTIRESPNLILLSEFWPFGLRCAGTSPNGLLGDLEQSGLRLYELTPKGRLAKLTDKQAFIDRYPDRNYANVVGVRGEILPGGLEPES